MDREDRKPGLTARGNGSPGTSAVGSLSGNREDLAGLSLSGA